MGRWEEDQQVLDKAMELYLANDWDGTEKLLSEGIENEQPLDEHEHDMRGAFAMIRAIINMLKGIATLADDQMAEAEKALKEADVVAAKDSNWPGKKVIRGVLVTALGGTQLAQKNFMKGLYNMLRAWPWISSLQTEGLEYDGIERTVVRSCSLFIVGSFNYAIGLMPPTLMKFTSFVTSFRGDREGGIRLIRTCFEEQGILAPFAAIFLLQLTTDTKTFFGETLTDEDFRDAQELIDWFDKNHPRYVFFNYVKADFFGVQRDLEAAKAQIENCATDMERFDGLHWLLNQKRALYAWCEFDFKHAGDRLKEAAQVYINVGRRSMVPFTTVFAMLSYLQAGDKEAALERASVILERLNSSKKNWGRQDRVAFMLFKRHIDFSDESKLSVRENEPDQWPLLDLCEAKVGIFRTNFWMNSDQLRNWIESLLEEQEQRDLNADVEVRLQWVLMDLYVHAKEEENAWKCLARAEEIEFDQSKTKKGDLYGQAYGVLPMMHMTAATLHFNNGNLAEAKASLQKVKSYGNKFTLNPLTQVKSTVMRKNVGLEFEGNFSTFKVPAGKTKTLVIDLPANILSDKEETVSSVTWYFDLQGSDIEHEAFCVDINGEVSTLTEKGTFSSHLGELDLSNLQRPAKLNLSFANNSWLTSKKVYYRLSPLTLDVEE